MSLSLRAAILAAVFAPLLFATIAHAQIPAHLERRRVVRVDVMGESSGVTGARDVGIPLGAPLTRQLLRGAVLRLLESGRWADVQIDAVPVENDVALIVHLSARIVIARVDVEGNAVLDDDHVRDALALGEDGALEGADLEPLRQRIADVYAERGYVDARATLTLRDTDDPSRKVMLVEIEEGTPLLIADYVFHGELPPSSVDLPGMIGLGEGAILDRNRLREGLEAAKGQLRTQGWLEARIGEPTIERTPGGAVIAIETRFGPQYEIRIVGHEPLPRSAIEEILDLEEERLTRGAIDDIRERVVDLWQRHGFHHATAQVLRYRGPRDGTAVLEVRMQHGHQLDVIGTSFPGATHFSTEYLRDQLISVLEEGLPDTRQFSPVDSETLDRIGLGGRSVIPRERSIPRPLEVDPGRVYYAPLYERAVEHLTEVYQADGYLSARIEEPRLEMVGRGRAIVVIPVFEGARTLLFGVTLQGNQLIGDRELLSAAELSRGQPFSYLTLEEAIERMTELYRERGFLYAQIEHDVRFSEDRERAEVVLRVVERFEVRFGEVRVEGNTRTSEGLIRDVLRFSPGDVYRPSIVAASQEALMGLGVFTSVNISTRDPDLAERVKPIVVTVTERDPNYVDGSVGISTGEGFRAQAEYTYRNLFGYALSFTIRGRAGFQFLFFQDSQLAAAITPLPLVDRLERNVSVSLALPQMAGLDNVRSTLDLVHQRDNDRSFGLDKNGVVLSFDWRPVRWLSFLLAGELEYNGVQLFGDRESIAEILEASPGDQRLTRLLRVPEGESIVVSSRVGAQIEQRDSPFVPTDGWFAAGTAEWVHTLETDTNDDVDPYYSHFLKLGITTNGYIPIGEVVLAGELRVGGIIHLEPQSRTYPNRQYFLGGVDSLRGFNQDQLQPQDLAEFQQENPEARTNTVLQGGDFFYLVRAELRFPIYGVFHGAVFADLGNHWADPASIVFDENFVRPTAGLGLRVVTPVGPIALDWGFNLTQRQELGEPIGALHLSFGVF